MDIENAASAQAARVNDIEETGAPDADQMQHPEVTALPQEPDPDDPEQHQQSSESNRKWSPLTTFWNEMGEDKPPTKKRE
jgi:hypothetical protein